MGLALNDARAGRRVALGTLANLSASVALAFLVVGAAVVTISFSNLLTAREQVFERLEPSLVATEKLRSSLLDQETGIRGFTQTRDERFLEPYQDGQVDELRLTDDLRTLLSDQAPARARLADVTDAAERWREEIAEPLVNAPAADGSDPAIIRSKTAFDSVRAAVDRLEGEVTGARSSARTDLDTATTSLAAAIALALAGVTLAGVFGSWLLRRRVILPIEDLIAQTDAVDLGRFDTAIDVTGPREIEQLAERVDDMRARLLAELAALEAAQIELADERASLERSNRDLEQFAYVASHDLQEPLRKVASFCQLIEQRYADELDDKGRLYIEYAVDGAKRMQALISDLLDFSRVGRNADHFAPCDLEEVVAVVVDNWSDTVRSTGARIEVGDLPVVVGDRSLLAALIQNLLGNAIKYRRPDLAPSVHLVAEPLSGEWAFSFTDNGIGIEENFRERVFVIFQRLHSRDAFEGTGIGLALCKKIVEFHGGRIWIDDPPPGGGTTVRWTLPRSPEDARQYPGKEMLGDGPAPSDLPMNSESGSPA